MNTMLLNPQSFYAAHGQISDPGDYAALFDGLPTDVPGMVQVIQGLMLHLHWAQESGITLNRIRKQEANLRTMKDRLEKIRELSDAPLAETRVLSRRAVATCRDYALFLTCLLRHQGIPARARCGFSKYFTPGRFEDHWVCEYWREDESRWVMADPQLDEQQIAALGIDFDTLDMPPGRFVTGARAWQLCRSGRADPNRFGIFRLKGLDFVKGDLIRDFLALNKIEIQPWDNFGLIDKLFHKMIPAEKDLMDRLARVSTGDDRDFLLVRSTFMSQKQHLLPRYFLGF
jgi:hypothetical protein